MPETRYDVMMQGETVAENMRLEYATVLLKALFNEYFLDAAETELTVSLKARMAEGK